MTPLEIVSSLRPDFWDQAACQQGNVLTEWFLPDIHKVLGLPNNATITQEAEDLVYATGRGICAGCGVKRECGEWARKNGEKEGLWGGEVLDERPWRQK